jgi:transcriptional regulator with XRE-family HTH domain
MDIMNEYTNMDEYATEFYNKMVVRLKEYCEIKDVSQGALSSRTGVAQSTISKMFSGEVKISLSHIAKFCKALEIDPVELFGETRKTQSISYSDSSKDSALIVNPSHMAFKGYLGEYNVYFNSTISSENTILHGNLSFAISSNGQECVADMVLYTGKVRDGKEIKKHYIGNLIISLSMSSCYCILTAEDIGEMCFFVFDHMFLFNEKLSCRLACAITTSCGGNRRPTMHRLLLCRDELDISNPGTRDFRFLVGNLKLNSSNIVIQKSSFNKMREQEKVLQENTEVAELLDNFDTQKNDDIFYKIDESLIRSTSYSMETKVEMLTLLREYSIDGKYNKISSKADEYVYTYLSNRNM